MIAGLSAGGALAGRLLADLAAATADPPGVTRAAYGQGEHEAHRLVLVQADAMGAAVRVDAVGNLYLTQAGSRPELPAILIGSHLDSVPHGGNFDGAAGVAAGLGVMAELQAQGVALARTLTIMVIRSEEACWFPLSYPGSQAAFGLLPPEALDARRSDTGRTLADHMLEAGFDASAVRRREAQIDAAAIAAFIEIHIEQGPRLVTAKEPVGIVTAIAGGFRYVRARVLGAYAHSGAEPRFSRRDSVLGFADLVQALEREWDRIEAAKRDATITFGRVESDPTQHGGSRVLGELGFTLDVRSADPALLDELHATIGRLCVAIASRRGVTFELGPPFFWKSARMEPALIDSLDAAASAVGLAAPHLSCGAGHDAATFASAGIPTAMLFVRNENGSHNPHESMDIADLDQAIRLMVRWVKDFATP